MSEKKNAAIAAKLFFKIQPEYQKFRKRVGEIAAEAGANPYTALISWLETVLPDEKKSYEEAKNNVNGVVLKIAGALGVKLEDLDGMELSKKDIQKILNALDDEDEKEDKELDF